MYGSALRNLPSIWSYTRPFMCVRFRLSSIVCSVNPRRVVLAMAVQSPALGLPLQFAPRLAPKGPKLVLTTMPPLEFVIAELLPR